MKQDISETHKRTQIVMLSVTKLLWDYGCQRFCTASGSSQTHSRQKYWEILMQRAHLQISVAGKPPGEVSLPATLLPEPICEKRIIHGLQRKPFDLSWVENFRIFSPKRFWAFCSTRCNGLLFVCRGIMCGWTSKLAGNSMSPLERWLNCATLDRSKSWMMKAT